MNTTTKNESKKIEQKIGLNTSAVHTALGTVKTDLETLMAAWTFAGPTEANKLKEMHLRISRWYSAKQGE